MIKAVYFYLSFYQFVYIPHIAGTPYSRTSLTTVLICIYMIHILDV